MMMPPVDLSLVLACYNEEPILAESIQEIVSVLDATRFTYELILVDDGSRDRTPALIEELAEKYRDTVAIRTLLHDRNTGRGGAVRDGMLLGRGEVVGFLDVDLEVHVVHVLPALLAIRRGADVVVGKRVYRPRWRAPHRYLMTKGYAWLVRRLLRLRDASDTEAGFKFFRRARLLPLLAQCRETGWFWDTEIMALADVSGLLVTEIPVLYERQAKKRSTVRPLHDSLDYLVRLWRFRTRLRDLRRDLSRG